MRISLALHIIGIVFWLGGLILLPRVMKGVEGIPQPGASLPMQLKRVFFGFVLGGFGLSLVSGVYQFFLGGGFAVYMKHGWFHGKLTLVAVLLAATLFLAMEIKKGARGEAYNQGRLLAIHAASASSLFIIVFLTFMLR